MINEIFSIDSKFWTFDQKNQIDQFFQSNSFFSKLYKHQYFDQVVQMTFYHKILQKSQFLMQNVKKPQAIILLKGKIKVYKHKEFHHKNSHHGHYHQNNKKSKKLSFTKIYPQQLEDFVQLSHENQTLLIDTQCKISLFADENDNQYAQILYIPSNLYVNFNENVNQQRIQTLYKDLRQFFPSVEKKFLINLARQACSYKYNKINDVIYKIGDMPTEVYLLIDGKVQMQKIHENDKKTQDKVIIHQNVIFGQNDILFQHRVKNAIVVSANCKMLVIKKNQFVRFVKEFLSLIQLQKPLVNTFHLPNLKIKHNSILNQQYKEQRKISRLHSISLFHVDKTVQTRVLKNCHILVDLSPRGKRSSRLFQKSHTQLVDYSKDQFSAKLRLFNKRRPNIKQFNIQNPLFDWTPLRSNPSNSPPASNKNSITS